MQIRVLYYFTYWCIRQLLKEHMFSSSSHLISHWFTQPLPVCLLGGCYSGPPRAIRGCNIQYEMERISLMSASRAGGNDESGVQQIVGLSY